MCSMIWCNFKCIKIQVEMKNMINKINRKIKLTNKLNIETVITRCDTENMTTSFLNVFCVYFFSSIGHIVTFPSSFKDPLSPV